MKIGYQGQNGTYSEMACIKYFKCSGQGYQDFKTLISDVANNNLDYALLPVENSTTGIIYRTYDLLKDHEVYAVGEVCLRIQEDLIGIKGACKEDIVEVYSHPEPLGQCATYLANNHMKPISYIDTASSVALVKSLNDKTKAALASPLACSYYDMETLEENVQDNKLNTTRFFIISSKKQFDKKANKISLYFVVNHQPGALYKVIECFAINNINLLKIESRPQQTKLFEYCFYIDFEGNMDTQLIQTLLKSLDQYCLNFKLLGCYQSASLD